MGRGSYLRAERLWLPLLVLRERVGVRVIWAPRNTFDIPNHPTAARVVQREAGALTAAAGPFFITSEIHARSSSRSRLGFSIHVSV
jgi:hypothetical protein